MRILVISPLFPPFADAEAISGGKFVQALMASGVDASVICSSDVRSPARIDASGLWDSIRRISIDIRRRAPSPALTRCWLGLRYQSTSWAQWTQAVVAKARELHEQAAFDLIVSRSLPHHAHLAGYWLASALRIPWVAVVNDPWDLSPFVQTDGTRRQWTPTLNWRIWWRRIVARVDQLCFPCERLRDFCLRGSPRTSGLLIVPHIGRVSPSARRPSHFTIVHAGRLGIHDPTGRSAVALLEGVEQLFQARPAAASTTRLLFVGPEDPEMARRVAGRLGRHVQWTGLVSYEESLEYIAQAAVCVLVEGDVTEGVFLPSKLCDYVAARKPVLALSPDVGTVADLAADGGLKRVHPRDSAAVAEQLVELFDAFVESRLDAYAPSASLVGRFDGTRVIQDFLGSVTPLTTNATR